MRKRGSLGLGGFAQISEKWRKDGGTMPPEPAAKLEGISSQVITEYFSDARVFQLLSVRAECGIAPLEGTKVVEACSHRFFTPWSVMRSALGGECDVVVAAGLSALPLHPNDLIGLTAAVGNNPEALFFVSKWEQVVKNERHTLYRASYPAQAVEKVFSALRRVTVTTDMGQGRVHSGSVATAIRNVLHGLQ